MKQLILLISILTLSLYTVAQTNMEKLGELSYSESLSDVWGYVDEEGNEYALVGTFSGLSIVDVTDPASPEEIFFGPGPGSIWRDMKTWGDYAYVSNESSGGIYIVDLSPLPDGPIESTTNFTGNTYPFSSSHNLYIDEFGKMYIFGANSGFGGAIICDLTQDPMNPAELGRFNDFYLHDGMARGDTLWGAGIYVGVLAAIDVSDPSNPDVMGTVSTPSQFAHNAWVSDDGTHVFTTDEVSSGYIGAFNVEDLDNMFETDRIQTAPGSGVIPHNAHVLNDYVITSYYTEGITIHDASNPDFLIEVGHYDTSPNYSGSGFDGSWGAYPFLPSGNILASDIQEGLVILSANYVRASFLQGTVIDSISEDPLFNVTVQVLASDLITQTAFDGSYEFGAVVSGTFNVKFSKEGYYPKVIEDVEIIAGQIVELNVGLNEEVISSINDPGSDNRVSLFPNPFQNTINLEYGFEFLTGTVQLEVYNLMGNVVERQVLNGSEGRLTIGEDLTSGIYFIKVLEGNRVLYTSRIIKQ